MVKINWHRNFFLLIALCCLLAPLTSQADFQAFVDRNPVTEGESLTLTLKSDENLDEEPDLKELQQDFDILGQSSGSSTQYINGQVTRSIQWQITLMPKRNGPLVIPAIRAGDQVTQAIVIGVNKANQVKADKLNSELFVEVSADPRTAYVQQQIIFSVKLYRNVRIGDSSLSEPKFPEMDAIVEKLGDDRAYQTTRNGQAYAVIERRYAVHPQASGEFKSSPVQFDGVIIVGNQGRSFFTFDSFSRNNRHKRVNSSSLSFRIKPAPSRLSGDTWLPAHSLKLSERWSSDPEKFIAGEPITRTLMIRAEGLAASQLPSLEGGAIDGFKFYPDQPVLKDNKDDKGIMGVRTQKVAILPTRAGSFILPSIEVNWWNVQTDKIEVARLPAKKITVLPAKVDANHAAETPVLEERFASDDSSMKEISDIPSLSDSLMNSKHANGWWPWIALVFAIAWLATFILWLKARKRKRSVVTKADNSESLRMLENQLKKYCMANDAPQAKSKLLAWAKIRWQPPPASLTVMGSLCHSELAKELSALDRALYAQHQDAWQGEKFWKIFNRHKSDVTVVDESSNGSLSPLYLA